MSNDITGQYFDHSFTKASATELIHGLARELDMVLDREIFCGKIYDADKVGSLLYAGTWQGKRAVLKLQILELPLAEEDILRSLAQTLARTSLHVPEVFAAQAWNREKGYGYVLFEEVQGQKIYRPPFATGEEQRDFCQLYATLHGLKPTPLVPQAPLETNSATFTLRRMLHWMQIGERYAPLTPGIVEQMGRFIALAGPILHHMPMCYMHGHLSMDDIVRTEDGRWVLMSNLFWSYRPVYYDATFHLWAGIKASRDLTMTSAEVIDYVEKWCTAYEALPSITVDPLFRPRFWVMMAERALSAQLIDIEAQTYHADRDIQVAHLREMFASLLTWSMEQVQKSLT